MEYNKLPAEIQYHRNRLSKAEAELNQIHAVYDCSETELTRIVEIAGDTVYKISKEEQAAILCILIKNSKEAIADLEFKDQKLEEVWSKVNGKS